MAGEIGAQAPSLPQPAAPVGPKPASDGKEPAPEPSPIRDLIQLGEAAAHWVEDGGLGHLLEGLSSWLTPEGAGLGGGALEPAAASGSVQQNASVVAAVARAKGVDPETAVATMLVESGGNARAVGDNGTSFGLFQLHRGGELGDLTPEQAFDPRTNSEVALGVFAQNANRYSDPGELAAASQRPADRSAYARKVNARREEARAILSSLPA